MIRASNTWLTRCGTGLSEKGAVLADACARDLGEPAKSFMSDFSQFRFSCGLELWPRKSVVLIGLSEQVSRAKRHGSTMKRSLIITALMIALAAVTTCKGADAASKNIGRNLLKPLANLLNAER
jgi:hypothetical protein